MLAALLAALLVALLVALALPLGLTLLWPALPRLLLFQFLFLLLLLLLLLPMRGADGQSGIARLKQATDHLSKGRAENKLCIY